MPEETNAFEFDYKTKEKQSYAIFVTAALQILVNTAAQQGFSANFECGVEALLASVPSDKFSEKAFSSTASFAREYGQLVAAWKIPELKVGEISKDPSFRDLYFWAQAIDLGPKAASRDSDNWRRVNRVRSLVLERISTDLQYRMKTIFSVTEKSAQEEKEYDEILRELERAPETPE